MCDLDLDVKKRRKSKVEVKKTTLMRLQNKMAKYHVVTSWLRGWTRSTKLGP